MAQPHRVLGGHTVAAVVAFFGSTILYQVLGGTPSSLTRDCLSAATVGVASLAMCLTGTEHAPAAGTALGLVLNKWTLPNAAAVLAAVLMLVVLAHLLLSYLVDLVPDGCLPHKPS